LAAGRSAPDEASDVPPTQAYHAPDEASDVPPTQAYQPPLRVARASAPGDRRVVQVPTIVAAVNTKRIERSALAAECLHRFGNEVLESMINKQLIVEECQRQGITVTHEEVNAEIERLAKKFRIPVDQWLKMLKQERNVTPRQYADDIIWPMLALRKLAGSRLEVSRAELVREFETQFGAAVRVRLIAVGSFEKAKSLRAQATANPHNFENLAKNYSEDPSASAKGLIPPIRQHGSYQEIEDAVFHMANGEISPIIHVADQYLILKREGLVEARSVNFDEVAPKLQEALRERKLHAVAQDIFHGLHERMTLVNVWNDPAKRREMPGVAAIVDGVQIKMGDLAEECIARHGAETLDALINRSLLEQACRKEGIAVTQQDLDEEIVHAASLGVRPKRDGSPDVDAWLRLVTKKQGIPLDIYKQDVVWPTAVLKKLVTGKVAVTEEDLRKGFVANYGSRVRCLAIVLNSLREAQEVFEMARRNNTSKSFGDLAEQYSIEPGSQKLRGEVPPIKKYGGQPQLEQEAFALRPGELSGIIQVGDKFIILRCEEYTTPVHVEFAAVREEIYRDLFEKKMHLAMREQYEKLQDAASIDNYLANTSHSPKSSGAGLPKIRPVSGG
jgi:parvulin-like peptidyl-prolyl isomerase